MARLTPSLDAEQVARVGELAEMGVPQTRLAKDSGSVCGGSTPWCTSKARTRTRAGEAAIRTEVGHMFGLSVIHVRPERYNY